MQTFDELVIEHDVGSLNTGLTRKMRELMKAIHEQAATNGKAKGEITLKFRFEATNNGRVDITSETSVKAPGLPKTRETRWIDDKGSLVAEDPRQARLPLKVLKQHERAPQE